MLSGSVYSQKFKDLEQERSLGGSDGLSHAQQQAARDKVRQLSLETNRRRRAQELRRRLEAQKEAKRRQEVLEERRRRQQEATQRYQRLQRVPTKAGGQAKSGRAYSDSTLHDGVNITRGYRANRADSHSNPAPALDEALRMVGVHTAPTGLDPTATPTVDYNTGARRDYSNTRSQRTDSSPYRKQVVDSNVVGNRGPSYHGYATVATATTPDNRRDNAGAQFQQSLHAQQRHIVELEQAALQDFSRAMLRETGPSAQEEEEDALGHSSSLSSLDSLEEERPKMVGHQNRQKGSAGSKRNTAGNTGGDTLPSRGNQERDCTVTTDHRLFTTNPSERRWAATANGELLVEETSENDFVREAVAAVGPTVPHVEAAREVDPSWHRTDGAALAWASPATTESQKVWDVYSGRHNIGSTGPARTTATTVTNYPARIPQSPVKYHSSHQTHQHGQQKSGQDPTKGPEQKACTTPKTQHVDDKYPGPRNTHNGVVVGEPNHGALVTTATDDTGMQPVDRRSLNHHYDSHGSVRSILKRTQGKGATTQKVKFGGVKVRDSIEISRATQQSNKSDQKSVRWTDLKYAEDRSHIKPTATPEQTPALEAASEKTKPVHPKTSEEAPRHETSIDAQRVKSIARTPPKGPTLLPRMAHNPTMVKPPPAPGRFNPRKESSSGLEDDKIACKNGLHLDKTPTDEEINWLWDKVRTCLSTRDHHNDGTRGQSVEAALQGRQPNNTTSKPNHDGNRLTANLRVTSQQVCTPVHETTGHRKFNTYPRLLTNSESSTASLRKTALLQHRRQHGGGGLGNVRIGYQGAAAAAANQHSAGLQPSPPSHLPGPTGGSHGPQTRTPSAVTHGREHEVSESLLTFQQAERLAQENLSESEIVSAIDKPPYRAYTAPTALSLEEQKILESLDKLNAQLRTVTSDTAMQPYLMIQPRPPPSSQNSGVHSHRPISSRQRAVADTNSTTYRKRTLSADRTNARINYYR